MNVTDMMIYDASRKEFVVEIPGGGSITDVPSLKQVYGSVPSVNVENKLADINITLYGEIVIYIRYTATYGFSGVITKNGDIIDTFTRGSGSQYNAHYKIVTVSPCDNIQIKGTMTGDAGTVYVDILGAIKDFVDSYLLDMM